MRTTMRTGPVVRRLLQGLLALVAMIVAYPLVALVLGVIPVNRDYVSARDGVEIFVVSNGIHSGLALPIATEVVDWRAELRNQSMAGAGSDGFVLVGWGDRTIYTQVGAWSSLRPSHVVTALLGMNASVLRAEHFGRPISGPSVKPVRITFAGYARLVEHVRSTLARGADGGAIMLPETARHPGDAFYLARGSFNAFRTCNEWVRAGLAVAGVRTAMWAPLDRALFWHLR